LHRWVDIERAVRLQSGGGAKQRRYGENRQPDFVLDDERRGSQRLKMDNG